MSMDVDVAQELPETLKEIIKECDYLPWQIFNVDKMVLNRIYIRKDEDIFK